MDLQQTIALLTMGAGRRILIAVLISIALWGGFYWAVAPSSGV